MRRRRAGDLGNARQNATPRIVLDPRDAGADERTLSPEEQLATGVTPGLVRLAVGIEGIDDIIADLEQGFAAAKPFAATKDPHAVASF